jgi:dipeptidyl-peptidase-4
MFSARNLLALFALLAPATHLQAQVDASQLSVDRLWTSPEFFEDRFGPARWLADGSGYSTLEPAADRSGIDIVRYDPVTGKREILVAASSLVPPGAQRPLIVEDYAWSDDGSKLLIFTNTKRVWRDNTRGDYWVLNRSKKSLMQLGADFEPSRLMFAKFSPSADRVAYVYRNDIYVQSLTDGKILRLTDDGSETIINGTFDWVYEEEFHIQDGFRWSPDGKDIAYWQLDASGVGEFYMVDNLSDIYAQIIPVQYPKAGTTNSSCKVGFVSSSGGDTRWIELDGDPRQNYVARMDWAGGSQAVVIQYLNRLQNTNRLMLVDAASSEVSTLLVEQDKAWLDVVDDLLWMDEGSRFTWLSERDGWRHLYIGNRSDGALQLVSPGDYEIVSIAHIDVPGGYVYAIASPEDATRRALYRIPLAGGEPERLTPEGAGGTHEYQISTDARFAIHSYSSFGSPPKVELISLPDHRVLRGLVSNDRLRGTMQAIAKCKSEFFRVKAEDGVELDCYYMLPPQFDAGKQWPVIFHVYGEPWSQTVVDRWGGINYVWHLLLAQSGYVIMSVDNRGTPGPKGREWRKSVYEKIGVVASEDQADGLLEIAKRFDWVDADRVGIWGWSGGGSMTLNMLFRHPEMYKVGVSVAPVPDVRLYDTIYQERYMGLPASNAEQYRLSSPITYARQLQGELLLVHGTGDDNVHYQGTERLVDELVRHDKQFTLMAYPNRSHGIFERPNTRRHLYKLMTRFFLEKLPAGAR